MGFLMRLAYSITNSYLLSILLFTLVMEIILIPFQVKQQKNQIQQAKLAPKANAIRKKYAGRNDQATQQKMNNEIMEMYQEEKYNPASGCGTLLIQFPIIICLYNVVVNPLRYICNVPKAEIAALKEFLVSAGHVFDGRNEQINITVRKVCLAKRDVKSDSAHLPLGYLKGLLPELVGVVAKIKFIPDRSAPLLISADSRPGFENDFTFKLSYHKNLFINMVSECRKRNISRRTQHP
jgi:YidC/Oxa1 family membrane protein insertase